MLDLRFFKNYFYFKEKKIYVFINGVRNVKYTENIKIFLFCIIYLKNFKRMEDLMNKRIIKILRDVEKL